MTFFATASGLTMDKVRSTAMQGLQFLGSGRRGTSPNVLFYQAFAGMSSLFARAPRAGEKCAAKRCQDSVRLNQVVASHAAYSFLRSLFPPLWRGSGYTFPRTFFSSMSNRPAQRIGTRLACYAEV